MTSGDGRGLAWTAAGKVASITQGTTVVGFDYDSEHDRMKKTSTDGTTSSTTYYYRGAGITVEKVVYDTGNVQWNDYISGGDGMVAEHYRFEDSQGTLTGESLRYFVRDHLGSISVITDESGAVVERPSFDAWGLRRNVDGTDAVPGTFSPYGASPSQTTRGFTGHEMIDGEADKRKIQ